MEWSSMSLQLISHSPDLQKLRDEGFDVEVRYGYLLVKDVPYVNSQKQVCRGILVSEMTTAGHVAQPPKDHVVDFSGELPCDALGAPLQKILHSSSERPLGSTLVVHHKFSSKPVGSGKYGDYYEKMTAYTAILSSHAQLIDPTVTAMTRPVVTATAEESVFEYLDSASSRAQISHVSAKLALERVAIIGLGGTGSYILDQVAKTPVKEIHLFDKDIFLTHNAFRAPGAAPIGQLTAKIPKVEYYRAMYQQMHRGIKAHPYHIDSANLSELDGMRFVFLCIDAGNVKRDIVTRLETLGIPFIDVGLGVEMVDDSLRAVVRVTTSTSSKRDHFWNRVSAADTGVDDEYAQAIQVADLNALNAVLAVIKWKKLFGFYLDFGMEHNSTFSLDTNALVNDDAA